MHKNVFSYVIHFHMQKRFYFIFFPCLIATKPNWITNTTIETKKKMYQHMPHRFSIIFRDFKISKLSPMVCIICNYLPSVSYLLVVLRDYTFKVHVFVSSEHTLSRVIYVLIIQISSIITVARLLDRSDQKLQHWLFSRTFNNI